MPIDAMVVLPDHLHCIWRLPWGDDDFPTRWRLIKSAFSRQLPATERMSASRLRNGEHGIWRRRYWEHLIRDDEDYRRHLDYIHDNPVKHGYVDDPKDWAFSSLRRWIDHDVYPVDWTVPRAGGGAGAELMHDWVSFLNPAYVAHALPEAGFRSGSRAPQTGQVSAVGGISEAHPPSART